MEFHAKLARLVLEAAPVSQNDIGRAVDIDGGHMSRLARGKAEPTREQLVKLARYFHVSVEWLADDAMDEPPPGLTADQRWVLDRLAEIGFPRARNRLLNLPDEDAGHEAGAGFEIRAGTPALGAKAGGKGVQRKDG